LGRQRGIVETEMRDDDGEDESTGAEVDLSNYHNNEDLKDGQALTVPAMPAFYLRGEQGCDDWRLVAAEKARLARGATQACATRVRSHKSWEADWPKGQYSYRIPIPNWSKWEAEQRRMVQMLGRVPSERELTLKLALLWLWGRALALGVPVEALEEEGQKEAREEERWRYFARATAEGQPPTIARAEQLKFWEQHRWCLAQAINDRTWQPWHERTNPEANPPSIPKDDPLFDKIAKVRSRTLTLDIAGPKIAVHPGANAPVELQTEEDIAWWRINRHHKGPGGRTAAQLRDAGCANFNQSLDDDAVRVRRQAAAALKLEANAQYASWKVENAERLEARRASTEADKKAALEIWGRKLVKLIGGKTVDGMRWTKGDKAIFGDAVELAETFSRGGLIVTQDQSQGQLDLVETHDKHGRPEMRKVTQKDPMQPWRKAPVLGADGKTMKRKSFKGKRWFKVINPLARQRTERTKFEYSLPEEYELPSRDLDSDLVDEFERAEPAEMTDDAPDETDFGEFREEMPEPDEQDERKDATNKQLVLRGDKPRSLAIARDDTARARMRMYGLELDKDQRRVWRQFMKVVKPGTTEAALEMNARYRLLAVVAAGVEDWPSFGSWQPDAEKGGRPETAKPQRAALLAALPIKDGETTRQRWQRVADIKRIGDEIDKRFKAELRRFAESEMPLPKKVLEAA
jgi:hypothetical protein